MPPPPRSHRPHATYELIFPDGLAQDVAARLFTALSSLFRPVRLSTGNWGRPTFVFELFADSGGPRYLLSVPPQLDASTSSHLRAAVPGLGLEASAGYRPRGWMLAAELNGAATRTDSHLIPISLGSFAGLAKNEAALAQFIIQPTGQTSPLDDDQPLFRVVGRAAVVASTKHQAHLRFDRILRAFAAMHLWSDRPLRGPDIERINRRAMPAPYFSGDALAPRRGSAPSVRELQNPLVPDWPNLLTPRTLAMLCQLPIGSPLVPGLSLGGSHKLPPDPAIPAGGPSLRPLLQANFPGAERPIALSMDDRRRHVFIVGPTGSGKSTLMETMIQGDLEDGLGLAVIDPKGDLVRHVLDFIPRHRVKDVVLYDIDTAKSDRAVGYNILAGDEPYVLAGQLVTVFDNLFDFSTNAPRATDVLRNVLITLAIRQMTMCEVPLILEPGASGQAFRDRLTPGLPNPALVDFWRWFNGLSARDQSDVGAPLIRRLRPLTLYPELRVSLGQSQSSFDMQQVLSQSKILLVPLAKARIGDENAVLLGTLVLTMLWNAVQAREPEDRRPFPAYIDEIKMVLGLPVSVTDMFSQAREFDFPLVVAAQAISQLKPEAVQNEVFQNARSKIAFQTDVEQRAVARLMGPPVTEQTVQSLGRWEVVARLLADNQVTRPVTATTARPPASLGATPGSWATLVRRAALTACGTAKTEVEAEIAARQDVSSVAASPGLPVAESEVGYEPWPE